MIAVVDHVSNCDGFHTYVDPDVARAALRRHPCRMWMRVVFCAACGGYHVRRRWD